MDSLIKVREIPIERYSAFIKSLFSKTFTRNNLRRTGKVVLWAFLLFFITTAATVFLLRFIHPPITSFMIHKKMAAWFDGKKHYHLRYSWTGLEHISSCAGYAAIAAEDQEFAYHHGFDIDAIRKSLARGNRNNRASVKGASTISQQVAKNLFLWPARSYAKKIVEAYFTAVIELLWPKERILEMYLNIAEFGEGIFGVTEASRIFFNKEPKYLSVEDASLLAASLPNPERYRVDDPAPFMQNRQLWIGNQVYIMQGDSRTREILEQFAHPWIQ